MIHLLKIIANIFEYIKFELSKFNILYPKLQLLLFYILIILITFFDFFENFFDRYNEYKIFYYCYFY